MGYQMTLYLHRKDGDKWVDVPVEDYGPMHLDEEPGEYLVVRDDKRALPETTEERINNRGIYGAIHQDWMGLNEDLRIREPRGIPEDMGVLDEMHPLMLTDYSRTWFMIDELVEYDYERVVDYYGTSMTAREVVGQPFIDWMVWLKQQGVERIVFGL